MRTAIALCLLASLARADGHKPAPDKFAARAAAAFDKAVAAEQAKRWREAVELYEQAFELSPHPNTIFNIASLYADHDEDKRALEALQLYLDLAPTATDRASVEQRITAILAKKKTVTLEASHGIELAESYVLIDGEIVARPGQLASGKLDVTYARGHHWAVVVSPTSYGASSFGARSDYEDRGEPIHIHGEPRGDGNFMAMLDYGIEGDLDKKHVGHDGVRLSAPAGPHWLKLHDHDHECRPVRVELPPGDDTAFVLVMPNEIVNAEVKRCRTLLVKQQRLVFKAR
jgi:tetratricopeptide (TPR) repeat protein